MKIQSIQYFKKDILKGHQLHSERCNYKTEQTFFFSSKAHVGNLHHIIKRISKKKGEHNRLPFEISFRTQFLIDKVYNTITEQIKVHKTYGKIGITPPESWYKVC